MKIEQAAVTMCSERSYTSEYACAVESTISFRNALSDADRQIGPTSAAARDDGELQARLLLMLQEIVGRLLEVLSGASSQTGLPDALASDGSASGALPGGAATGMGTLRPRVVMDWSRVATQSIEEHESTDFASTGRILTADGRSLDFALGLSMCRDYSCQRTTVEAGSVELCDPLVINFDGQAAELCGQCFAFDLDSDGTSENIHALGGGSGYLAIDRNADGRINDGSELFGTVSGDGFADLARLDADGNRWIDEADPAFATLRVWQHDAASGDDALSSLAESGVGALYLGSAATQFALTDSDNRLFGQVRSSGIYLNENGSAGTLQQVDLAV